jgi:hypothetical protein
VVRLAEGVNIMNTGSRIVAGCAAVAAIVGLSLPAVPAVATPPVAGAHYKGMVVGGDPEMDTITFTVSADGDHVTKTRAGQWPITTCGTGGPPPAQSSKPARIKDGKFTAHVVFRVDGEPQARATVKGTFLRHGKERGTVKTVLVGGNCNAVTTVSYKTEAQ